jgi:hypothetical protein
LDIFKDKDKSPNPTKEDQIRQMGGHGGDLETAISSAPDDTGIAIPSATESKPRGRRKSGPQPVSSPQPVTPIKSQAEIEAERKRNEAVRKIQSEMAKDVAGLPYEAWAFIAQDNSKALSKEEEKELAEAYAMVAETLTISVNPLWTGIMFILSRNAKFVRARLPKDTPEMEAIKNALPTAFGGKKSN